ncbi:MAG: serine/threonine-protein kinase [Methylococcaceae bacterium]|nr:serine/threonine-protein kinase [Methylococcaceae bacterium]
MNLIDHKNALPPGYELEAYTIESLLGHGGFGITYLARDRLLEKPVAIKEYLPQEFAVREGSSTVAVKSNREQDKKLYRWGLKRFVAEARNLARFNHPNIVRVLRFIEANNSAYLVMDYEPGQSLQDYLERRGFGLEEPDLKAIFLPVLDGLRTVHENGLLHRDIKPHNIYLRADSSPMLIDFGSARVALGERSRSLVVVFTPGFAPYEQYSSRGNQGPWTDVYGIGASLYYCMSGQVVPDANDRSFALLNHEPDPYRPIRSVVRGRYSDALLDAIDAALKFQVKSRLQTVRALESRWTEREFPEQDGQQAAVTRLAEPDTGRKERIAMTEPAESDARPMPSMATDRYSSRLMETIAAALEFHFKKFAGTAQASGKPSAKKNNTAGVGGRESPLTRLALAGYAIKNQYTTIVSTILGVLPEVRFRRIRSIAGVLISCALLLGYALYRIDQADREKTQIALRCEALTGPKYQHDIAGSGVTIDKIDADRAVPACEKALELEPDSAKYQTLLGQAFEAQKDNESALELYRKAAEKRYALAQNNLGRMSEQGDGVIKDPEQAMNWYRKAAEQGLAWGQYNLGRIYETGPGVSKDFGKAVAWYHTAAAQGHASAQVNLGRMYEKGNGVPKSFESALAWYRKAAGQHDAWAQYNLGRLYEKGRGVPKDYEQAFGWYRKAAEQGHEWAQFNVAWMYEKGKGVDKDSEKAAVWYRKSAQQGNAWAQNNLGSMYTRGKGVAKDLEKARHWYRQAADQGLWVARDNLKGLGGR